MIWPFSTIRRLRAELHNSKQHLTSLQDEHASLQRGYRQLMRERESIVLRAPPAPRPATRSRVISSPPTRSVAPSANEPGTYPWFPTPSPAPAYEPPAPSPAPSYSSGGGGDFGGGGASSSWDSGSSDSSSSDSGSSSCSSSD